MIISATAPKIGLRKALLLDFVVLAGELLFISIILSKSDIIYIIQYTFKIVNLLGSYSLRAVDFYLKKGCKTPVYRAE